jgi:hypothetical protein
VERRCAAQGFRYRPVVDLGAIPPLRRIHILNVDRATIGLAADAGQP